MRGAWIVTAILVAGLACPPARAGVYFTTGTLLREFARPTDPDAQELWPLPSPFPQFQQDLADFRAGALSNLEKPQDESPIHKPGVRRVAELEAKNARGSLNVDDCINLGAYHIRLGEYQKAIDVMNPKAEQG